MAVIPSPSTALCLRSSLTCKALLIMLREQSTHQSRSRHSKSIWRQLMPYRTVIRVPAIDLWKTRGGLQIACLSMKLENVVRPLRLTV